MKCIRCNKKLTTSEEDYKVCDECWEDFGNEKEISEMADCYSDGYDGLG